MLTIPARIRGRVWINSILNLVDYIIPPGHPGPFNSQHTLGAYLALLEPIILTGIASSAASRPATRRKGAGREYGFSTGAAASQQPRLGLIGAA